MSGEKKLSSGKFSAGLSQVQSTCSDERVGMKLNFLENNWKTYLRFWAKRFQTLSTKFRQHCQIASHVSRGTFSRRYFPGTKLCLIFFGKLAKKAGFLPGRFPQSCRNFNLSVESVNSTKETVFEKIYIFSQKNSLGFWAKVLRILVDKLFLQGCCNCSKPVQNNILRKK